MDATELLNGIRLMPVIVIDEVEHAVPLAIALRDAGVRAMEITLRTPAALDALTRIHREVPEMLLGVGSVRRPEQFAQAQAAGAGFAVSPGVTPRLLQAAESCGLPYLPGAATATEVLQLLENGYRLQKFFPAEQLGGAATLKALSAPLPEVRFCPTGGVNAQNALHYLALPQVACIGGSWFIPSALLAAEDFTTIGEQAVDAIALTRTPAAD